MRKKQNQKGAKHARQQEISLVVNALSHSIVDIPLETKTPTNPGYPATLSLFQRKNEQETSEGVGKGEI